MNQDKLLIRVGGVSALAVAATQLIGNALHPAMPEDTVERIQVINDTTGWAAVHLVITISYFLFIPFVLGTLPAFRNRSGLVRLGAQLVLIGAALGVAQILTHLTIFTDLAGTYTDASTGLQASIASTFGALWEYSVALEVAHLLAIFVAASLFGVAMLREPAFRRWMAWTGIGAGGVASAAILISKGVAGRTGDLIFGFSLLPLIVWIVAIGITLLRLRPEARGAPVGSEPPPRLAPARPSG